jgi:hypothetical protein
MTDDLVKRLREGCSCNFPDTPCGAEDQCRAAFEAADRIEQLESLFPAILEYLEEQADVVDGDSGIPAPNRAMALLVWTRHELEKK